MPLPAPAVPVPPYVGSQRPYLRPEPFGLGIPNLVGSGFVNSAAATVTAVQTRDLAPGETMFFGVSSRATTVVTINSIANDRGYSPVFDPFRGDSNATQFTSANLGVCRVNGSGFTAGTTWTVTLSANTGKRELAIYSVSGLVDADADQSAVNNGNGTAVTVGPTGGLSVPDCFVFTHVSFNGSGVVTIPTSGYRRLLGETWVLGVGSAQYIYSEWKTVASTAAVSGAPTTSDTANPWAAVIAAYRILIPAVAVVIPLIQPMIVPQAVSRAAVR